MNIDIIKDLCKDETIEVSQHFAERCRKRGITYKEAKEAILSGKIIEEYPDDYPFESCLILGVALNLKILHVVAGIGNNKLWLITVYEPDRNRWNSTFTERRTNNE